MTTRDDAGKAPMDEALRSDPKEREREAQRIYDADDRREVEDAQAARRKAEREKARGGDRVGSDPIIGGNVRKPG